DPDFDGFFTRLTDLLALLLPRFNEEGKSYLTIAIGCTGGRHRSVYVAERLRDWIAERMTQVELRHRELSFELGADQEPT
ncbi:MAG: RNase adaptor protein RapZ, partial [Rhodospirillaceae bacterium]|nr:RNase adaptor protein RapZ [Rhodospirillaceae bacterium]